MPSISGSSKTSQRYVHLATASGPTTYGYTPANQLARVTTGGVAVASYADGGRVQTVAGSVTTDVVRGAQGELLAAVTNPAATSPLRREYVYGGSRLLAVDGTDPAQVKHLRTTMLEFTLEHLKPEGGIGPAATSR